jgi:uncharacterized damage-inducible protein DinB
MIRQCGSESTFCDAIHALPDRIICESCCAVLHLDLCISSFGMWEHVLMSPVIPWFERKFDFLFSVELRPNILARLRGSPARLEEIVHDVSRQALTRKPEGKWSAQEHAGHLFDLEPLWLARVEDYVNGVDQLTVADLRNRKTDDANHNAHPVEQILRQFRSAREKLMCRVDRLDGVLFSRSIPHPRLKTPMRLVDHLYFVAEHDDHHLAQIWELISQTGG